MSKFTNRMKEKFSLKQKAAPPRAKAEIGKEYSETIGKAGQTEYLVYVYSQELEQLNKKLLSLNQEAAARDVLDKEEAKKQSNAEA